MTNCADLFTGLANLMPHLLHMLALAARATYTNNLVAPSYYINILCRLLWRYLLHLCLSQILWTSNKHRHMQTLAAKLAMMNKQEFTFMYILQKSFILRCKIDNSHLSNGRADMEANCTCQDTTAPASHKQLKKSSFWKPFRAIESTESYFSIRTRPWEHW